MQVTLRSLGPLASRWFLTGRGPVPVCGPGIGDPRSLPFDTTLLTQACILGYLPARGRQVDGPSAGTGGGASDGLGPACRPAGGHVLLVIS